MDQTQTVTLAMADIRPHLDEVLKYSLKASSIMHLPPSVFERADLTTETNRRALVEYALAFAGKCAREKANDLVWDPDDGDADDFRDFDTSDLEPRRPRARGRPKPRDDSADGFANVPRDE